MEIVVILAVVGIALWWFAFRKAPQNTNESAAPYKVETPLDVNKDGKVNLADATAVVTKVADVNKDGKVDVSDAKEVAKKAKSTAKKASTKAKTAVSKAKTAVKAKKAKPASQA